MNKKGEAEVVIVFAVIALFVIIISGFSVAVGAVAPYGYKITPTNGTSNSSLSIQFVFNATDDTALKNATLYVWNSTNSQVYTNFTVITGTFNLSSIWNVFTQAGLFFWNVLISDSSSDLNWTYVGNYSFTITDATPPYFTYLANVSIQTNDSVNIDYNATDNLVLDNWITNDTRFSINASGWFKNSSGLSVGLIFVNITINDTSNNINSSVVFVNISAVADLTVPAITILLPANSTYASTTSTFNVTLNENGTDCLYSLDGAGNITMTNKNNSDFGAINSTMAQGSHNVIYSCNDTSNNRNASVTRYFSTDSVFPLLSIAYPTNISYSINVSALNYSITELNKDRCWYGNSTANFTDVAAGVNFTSVQSNEGSNTWTVYCNDTANNLNSTSVTFTKDTTVPAITILLPANTSYASTTSTFNVTLNENGTDCLYSLDGAGNITMTNKNNSDFGAINSTMAQGSHNVIYSCNDTSNNRNASVTRYFSTDSVAPYFTYLANVSIQNNDSVGIDYNATDTIAFENFSVNDTRFSINASGWFKNSSGLSIGVIFVNITINDTSNNKNSSVVFVNISIISSDTTFPIINIAYPTNISYSINVSALNYSITELNKDRCWYGNSTANFTDVAAGVNFTSVQSNEGSNTWTVYCNDTANNLNSTSVTFTKDTTVPAITILLPANTSYASTTSTFNVTLNENGTDCLYSLDGAGNITMTNKNNSDFGAINSTMAQGSHNVIYSCNDTSNNRNASVTRYFSTDSVAPYFTYLANVSIQNNDS